MAIGCVRLPGGCWTLAPCVPPHPTGGPRGWLPPPPRSGIPCLPAACLALARSPARARRMGQRLVHWGGGVSVRRGRYSLRVFFSIAALAGASFSRSPLRVLARRTRASADAPMLLQHSGSDIRRAEFHQQAGAFVVPSRLCALPE